MAVRMVIAAAMALLCLPCDSVSAQSNLRSSANSGIEIRRVKTVVDVGQVASTAGDQGDNAAAKDIKQTEIENTSNAGQLISGEGGDTSEAATATAEVPENIEQSKLPSRGTEAMDESSRVVGSGKPVSMWRGLFNTIVALAVVLGIIFVLFRLLKRWQGPGGTKAAGNIEVLGRASITHRHGVALVRVGPKVVAVGIAPESICALTEISDPHQVSLLLGEAQKNRPDSISNSFASALDEQRLQEELAEAALENSSDGDDDSEATGATGSALDRIDDLLNRVRKLNARDSYGSDGKGGKS